MAKRPLQLRRPAAFPKLNRARALSSVAGPFLAIRIRARPQSTIADAFPKFSDEQQTISGRPRHIRRIKPFT
jgi:hypothetical protein